ncbi:MAG: hypothetical protein ACRDV9_12560 [Acidimicrobiia bacterium]
MLALLACCVGGLDNAGWDLAFNAVGSAAAAIACTLHARPDRPRERVGDDPLPHGRAGLRGDAA